MDTYIFRESSTWKGKPTKSRRTFVFIDGGFGTLAFGKSQCFSGRHETKEVPPDQFLRKRGLEMAAGRAHKAMANGCEEVSCAHVCCKDSALFSAEDLQIPREAKRGDVAKILLAYLKGFQGFRWQPKSKPQQQTSPGLALLEPLLGAIGAGVGQSEVAADPKQTITDDDIPF